MEKYGFIDTDSHVIEPDDLWDNYLEAKFQDDAPVTRVGYKTDENGFGFFNDVTIGDCNQPFGFFGHTSVMPNLGEVYDEYARQGFPASSYIDAMDKVGIDYMVLYPTAGLYTNQAPDTRADVAAAYRRAYNNWLYDFCSEGDGRLIGAGALDLRDPDLAAREAIRCVKDLGFKAVMINPSRVGPYPLYAPEMDRLWATVADLDVPVGIHGSALNAADNYIYELFPDNPYAQGTSAFVFGNMAAIASFITGGVLERHPTLRTVNLEAGSGWLVPWLYRMQVGNQGGRGDMLIPGLTMQPIDYWKRQCFISTEPGDPGINDVVNAFGDECVVVATDFSHPEGRQYVTAPEDVENMEGLSKASKRKIAWDNALRLYPIDVHADAA
jgi:predicted TIM-barrel fold metal-dependent hydrolase